MSGGRDRKLTHEDRILWGRVAKSVTPMPGKSAGHDEPEAEDFSVLLDPPPPVKPEKRPKPPMPSYTPVRQAPPPAHGIDRPTRARLAKGRLAIEGKVDLHDLTQSEAHALLLSFLHRAYADGRRHVLVVTGKGASLGSEGVLRRAVPGWLATPPFRALVSAHEPAASRHGGAGALYVRLRRRDGI
ncbi:MAG: Smr/MutS family protein [Aquamicrobium sp.]|uniref:Smr/MutS family protein n=1 Tax=Aquamicrobium sp. TaxID=1872579 RepID=UPI00349EC900|nr:Smr/MutS family protein [Aquamicrobium sp.]